MLVTKSRNKAETDQAQREYWWRKTPQERLEAARELIRHGRLLYAANSDNLPLFSADGTRVFKAATPIRRRGC